MFDFLYAPSKGLVHPEGHPSFEGSPKKCMTLSQIWVAYFTWVTLKMQDDLHY